MQQFKVWIILISVWIIIASSYPAIKIAVETIPPILMEGIKSTFGGLILFLIFKISLFKFFNNTGMTKNERLLQENGQEKILVK